MNGIVARTRAFGSRERHVSSLRMDYIAYTCWRYFFLILMIFLAVLITNTVMSSFARFHFLFCFLVLEILTFTQFFFLSWVLLMVLISSYFTEINLNLRYLQLCDTLIFHWFQLKFIIYYVLLKTISNQLIYLLLVQEINVTQNIFF